MNHNYEFQFQRSKESPFNFHSEKLCSPHAIVMPHWHENIELLFMTEGITEVMLNDNCIHASAGTLVVINSNTTHQCYPVTYTSEFECLIIDKNFCEQFGLFTDENFICSTVSDERLFSLMKNLKHLNEIKPKYFYSEITSDVLKILSILFREYAEQEFFEAKNKNKNVEMVTTAIRYINKHLKENLNIDKVAEHVGYSKCYFCSTFKDITGCTVNSYINQKKILQIYRLLGRGEKNINEIATEYGFNDVSYFTKVFKKYAKTLPSKVKTKD